MTPTDTVAALRALVSLARTGHNARGALVRWADRAPAGVAAGLRRSARLARLGAPLETCIEGARPILGTATDPVAAAVGFHRKTGADLGALIDALARDVGRRAGRSRGAEAHAAGARLTARMVALLPIATIPLAPYRKDVFLSPGGIGLVLAGLTLALVGSRWIERLMPRPAEASGSSWVPSLLAEGLRAGIALPAVLEAIASGGRHPPLTACRRRVVLGLSWREALEGSGDPELVAVAAILRRAERSGIPLADQIDTHIAERIAADDLDHEGEVRRAPVRMAVPLVVCVLPSFVLLGLAPYLLGGP